ncbi:uncharacterized protein M6B38_416625 [Iris pallida]|uniref:VPS9 domain-containing protein n=1 Tax=Iris pallida TaxID=29817 RepID=A0AAX6FKE0_IRIPA|nr:uncharacterized protein M6B38_416625 [Iris pallida]
MDSSSSSHLPEPNFYDFLRRMRSPASADLVRAIKSFIVSFSLHTIDAENDSRKLQDFLMAMETNIRKHPLWINCTDEERDTAVEGLEKYVMTKLFNRTFASSPGDAKSDMKISKKICLLQQFIKPDHLDVPKVLQNEASLLYAAKELQKINAFKAPREKLLCIMNCCRVINNLLLNVSLSTNHMPAGADDFLPTLIYVIIRANPPQLHSNLKFIQLFRWQSKLVSEVEYYLTNLLSAESFISNIDASSLSMDEIEFKKNMHPAATQVTLSESSCAVESQVCEPNSILESLGETVITRRSPDKGTQLEGNNYPFLDKEAENLSSEDVQSCLGYISKWCPGTRHYLKLFISLI